jgi:hypothetical protein
MKLLRLTGKPISFPHLGVKKQVEELSGEIPGGLGAKKQPGEQGGEQSMHRELRDPIEDAHDYVECDPHERQPSRPVMPTEHIGSGNNRQEADEFDPYAIESECIPIP